MSAAETPVVTEAPGAAAGVDLLDWLTTTDHKRIGVALHHVAAFGFFDRRRACWRW